MNTTSTKCIIARASRCCQNVFYLEFCKLVCLADDDDDDDDNVNTDLTY